MPPNSSTFSPNRLFNAFLRLRLLGSALLTAALAASAVAQDVSLEARVDRSTIRENESFTYILRALGQVRDEPDFTSLTTTFDILQRYRKNQKIVSGQAELITEWLLQLMPRSSGSLTLPPISLAGAFSNAIEIEVLPTLAGDVPKDIFLEVEAAPLNPDIQALVVYTLRLFRGVSTGRSTLTPAPQVLGGKAIIERLGGDREYQVLLDDRNFIVIERRYAVFPQATGELTIEPVTFEAVVTERSGFSSVRRFRSDAVELVVQPPTSPPAGLSDAGWLPAQNLTLSERWSAGTDELIAGVPRTRTVVLEAEGLLETQLPELRMPRIGGLRQYPDQPEISRETTENGLRVRRMERFAVIAQSSGELELPALEVPWWNVRERQWQVARLESRTLTVLPDPEQTPAAAVPSRSGSIEETLPAPGADRRWQVMSGGLALAWLVTLALWWRSEHRGD